jgi:hypothetical protein
MKALIVIARNFIFADLAEVAVIEDKKGTK